MSRFQRHGAAGLLALAALIAPWTLSAAPSSAPAAAPEWPQSPAAWAQAAREDIDAAYRITLANHPGVVDPHNPGFAAQLDSARRRALSLAERVRDVRGFDAAIDHFSAALRDGHAGAFAELPEALGAPPLRWPGFVVAWRGTGLWVARSALQDVAAGAEVVSCDGQPVAALIADRVFAFEGQVDQPGHWWYRAGLLMIDTGNPFLPPLQQCDFRTEAGVQTLKLTWTPRPAEAAPWRVQSTNGELLPVGRRWLDGELAWVALPTFNPNAEEVTRYETLMSQLAQERSRLLKAAAIVIDLRHNQGGSSTWSQRVAEALWGAGPVKRTSEVANARTEVWWRASAGNIQHVKGALLQALERTRQTELLDWARTTGAGMEAAQAQGEPFYRQPRRAPSDAMGLDAARRPRWWEAAPVTAPVWVIVPGQCASACLDALDVFKRFPNTRLIGAPSSADSTYMEVRLQPTPSGRVKVILPTKVYVNRPRGNGEHYAPDVLHTALDWSGAAFEQHIRRLLPPTAGDAAAQKP